MRIVAGKLGSRQFESPNGRRTHPMSDKVRGALFNMLGDLEGLNLLDAFAGSGGISFEAISRGAKQALAIESDPSAQKIAEANIKSLGLKNQVKLIKANAAGWSKNNPDTKFDLVVCDPPYDQLQITLLQKLVKHLVKDGLYVLSWPGDLTPPEFIGLEQIKDKNYGDAQLIFYRRLN